MIDFIIPVPPVTKKNSQRIFIRNGRPFIMPSEKYKQYEQAVAPFVKAYAIDYAVNVRAVFYMPTRRRADLVNLQEALLDVLVKYGCLTDDNYNIVASMNGSQVKYDKDNPRTEVFITEVLQNGDNRQTEGQ